MASKVLDILLQLSVEGAEKAAALKKSVEQLKAETAKGGRTLDDILAGKEAIKEVDLLTVKTKGLFDLIASKTKTPIDLNIGGASKELDLLTQKTRTFIDVLAQSGKTRVDFDLSKVNRDLDIVAAKGRQLFDMVQTRGKQKIDFDLGKVEVDAKRANDALNKTREQAAKTRGEVEKLGEAHKKHATSIGESVRELLFFRRVLLGLGIVATVQQVLTLVQAFDKARQALAAVFGEAEAAAQFKFIQVQAERLGVSLTELSTEYAKFTIASRSLGLTQEETRDVFLSVAEAGSKLALSSEQVVGALTALQQIASKGRLSMEELRQQLGDRLPGAISIAAKAMGVTEARLFAMVEQGQIASDVFLRKFPAALRASFGTDSATRIETTAAAIQRFQNALQELIDEAVRAGVLQLFTQTLKDLVVVMKDPATITFLKEFASGVATVGKIIKDNIDIIILLGKAFIGYKLLNIASTSIGTIAGAFTKLGGAMGPVVPLVSGATGAVKELGKVSSGAAPNVLNLASSIGSLALATKNPIVLVIAGLTAANIVLWERLIKKWEEADKAIRDLTAATAEAESQGRIVAIIEKQIAAFEQYSEVVALNRKEIDSLSKEGVRSYAQAADGAQQYYSLATKAASARIKEIEAEVQILNAVKGKNTEQIKLLVEYKAELDDLKKIQEGATAEVAKFAKVQEDVAASAKDRNIALSEHVARLQELAKTFETLPKGKVTLPTIDVTKLNDDVKIILKAFDDMIVKGEDVKEALEKAIPKNFSDLTVKVIADTAQAFAVLEQEGKAAAKTIEEVLLKALDKLTGDQLAKFGTQAKAAFDVGALGAKGLALVIDTQLKAALKNMGLEADTAGSRISKSFSELVSNFKVIAENANVTGRQLKGALDVAIQAAKTKEELDLLKAAIEQLGLAGGKFADDIQDSLLRLDDAIRLSATKIDTALGDSFDRLGIKAKSQLKAIADQAQVDFERIKQSGQATALQLEEAWRKMAEEVTKLNNGIPPLKIVAEAVDFNAFDVIVKAAEEASVRVRKAIETAIPLVETEKQARALGDAITLAFDKGKISAQEFGKLITEVGFQIRELAVKPVGELAAAADLLGLKTKDQLKAVADNAREAFQIVSASGQFTNEQLAKGAQQFLDAYTAANSGVVDSFDPVIQKAQEVLASVGKVNQELTMMASKTDALRTVGGPDLGQMDVGALQNFLKETVTAYRNIGVQNVQDLRIVQDIQQQLAARGKENSDILRKKIDDGAKALQDAGTNIAGAINGAGAQRAAGGGGGTAVVGGGGAVVNNFNFNGTGLTADAVKRQVMPVIDQTLQRRR